MSEAVTQTGHLEAPAIFWSVNPNETDWLAWAAIVSMALAVYLVMYLYGKFDQWAEHKAESTPLAKTIPTLLAVALLYEIFPLDHFNILLPLSAILIAVMADWMRERSQDEATLAESAETDEIIFNTDDQAATPAKEPDPEPEPKPDVGVQADQNENASEEKVNV